MAWQPGGRGTRGVKNIGEELAVGTDENVNGIQGGVSVIWLMKAFRMGRARVERSLIGCPTIGYGRNRIALYDLPTAASYLVEPKRDMQRFISEADVKDLPIHLQEPVWNAKLKEQKYLVVAGELWPTELVVAKIAEFLSEIKAMLTILPDDLERDARISPKQREIAKEKIGELQEHIYQQALSMSKRSFTPSQLMQHLAEIEVDAGDIELGDDQNLYDDI